MIKCYRTTISRYHKICLWYRRGQAVSALEFNSTSTRSIPNEILDFHANFFFLRSLNEHKVKLYSISLKSSKLLKS